MGVDWGTSASKLVVRDLGVRDHDTGAAYPLLFSGGSPRYPATVALEGGRLWFGEAAETRRDRASLVWDSLKARAGAGTFWEEAAVDGLRLQDLVTLSLTHLLAVARAAIGSLSARSMSEPRIRATVGVPTRELQQAHGRYLDCTLAAIQLALVDEVDPQGCSIVELRARLDRVAPKVELLRVKAREEWDVFLRPEPLSAILWLHRLPQVAEGPYCLVDVGAATVHASFFRIHQVHDPDGRMIEKGGAALFGAESGLCGMDTIGHRLSEIGLAPSHVAARGKEAQLMAKAGVRKRLEPQLSAMRSVWREADRAARKLTMCTSDR